MFVGSWDNYLYALDAATGALRWRYQTGGVLLARGERDDATVFVGSYDKHLYAARPAPQRRAARLAYIPM